MKVCELKVDTNMRQRIGQRIYWWLSLQVAYKRRLARPAMWLFWHVFVGYTFRCFRPEKIRACLSSDVKPLFMDDLAAGERTNECQASPNV